MSAEAKKSYKETLNLPQTAFSMEAKLVTNEPVRLAKWKAMDLYRQVMDSRKDDPLWVLHDGPPFANGDIHMGHVTNKTLKDIILRFKTMQGYRTPYVPGWDCHGLPIEAKIAEENKKSEGDKKAFRDMTPLEIRQKCFASATEFAGKQSEQFQRLGILGDWANPYLTMAPAYEASTLEVFAKVVENGLVYKQLKTVPWSITNQTALADAELEYQDVEDLSIYVEFPLANPGLFKSKLDIRINAKCSLMIWTTTPWTLPANLAVAANPEVDYAVVKFKQDEDWYITVLAEALRDKVLAKVKGLSDVEVLKVVKGDELLGLEYKHPFVDRIGKILPADYVTTTDGTGLVHTAPGHGEDDYNTGVKNGLDVYCPVLANGRFDSSVPNWLTGLTVWEGNAKVVENLTQSRALFAQEKIMHSYPHDWRSKTKIIFRATEQWFVGIDKAIGLGTQTVREMALDAVNNQVTFIPDWGKARITGMLQSRPDWCISRQRSWGLPIPVFYNERGEALLTPDTVRAVARAFAKHGSDAWFTLSATELLEGVDLPPEFPKDQLRKEKDIFDVWFESGSSWMGVLKAREPELRFPADLYLEGSDQHRGWFQLSMLPALASFGEVPFKNVLTHGFIVGPDGKKVSKSDKNYVKAMDEINRHGADLLRLFVSSADYEGDMAASPKMIQDFGDKYRKIRNTIKYLLSNLYDYDGKEIEVPANSLDGWAMAQLDELIATVVDAYNQYHLHRAFRAIHDFCAVQISSIYGNAMKDRLYCDAANSPLRRRSQYVMNQMLIALTKLVAPILMYTADEAWEHIAHKPAGEAGLSSVHLARLPQLLHLKQENTQWDLLLELREEALGQLDVLKKQQGVNKALDAEIVYPRKFKAKLESFGVDLEDMVGVGYHRFDDAVEKVTVLDTREKYPVCARSWKRRPDVGSDPAHPDLSARDAAAVKGRM